MAVLSLKTRSFTIGTGQPLAVIAGLNVIEDLDLALSTGRHLKAICADLGLPYVFKASYDKGILTVTVPLEEPETPERHVAVESAG